MHEKDANLMQKRCKLTLLTLLTYSPEYLLTYLISYWLTHTRNKLNNYLQDLSLIFQHTYILLHIITLYHYKYIYHNITKILLIDCVYKDCNIQKSCRFSIIIVEKINQSRKLEKYLIINFSSLKNYTTESSRPPSLVPPTLSLQYHR